MQGTAGWAPTLEGQAAPALWATSRGSQVVGHSEELCLCSVSRGNPGRAVGRGGAGSDLRAGFYEDESQRNRSGCRRASWRQLQWPMQEGTVVLIRSVQSRLGEGGFWDCLGRSSRGLGFMGGGRVCAALAHVPGTPGKSRRGQSDWGSPGPPNGAVRGTTGHNHPAEGTGLGAGVTVGRSWDRRLRVEETDEGADKMSGRVWARPRGHLCSRQLLVARPAAGEKGKTRRAAWRLVPGAKSSDHRCPTH